jgi:hypothetical protein
MRLRGEKGMMAIGVALMLIVISGNSGRSCMN